ncbi:MAG: pentapeptide repeat-containing protein, partial [Planctomycetes bacterium]|nr:pentapeptide repeat-containing protein [Planctomycetota bacterium]
MLARDGVPVIVRPRVFVKGGEAFGTSLLEDVVRRWLDEDRRGVAYLCGASGSGKTTAFERLRGLLAGDARLVLRDESPAERRMTSKPTELVLQATRRSAPEVDGLAVTLAGWQLDDCIEYALGAHRERCRSVMNRWHDAHADFDGNPELCRIAIDRLAADDSLFDARMAVARHFDELLGRGAVRDEAIRLLVRMALARTPTERRIAQDDLEFRLGRAARTLFHGPVGAALAAERVAAHIELGRIDPAELVDVAGDFVQRLESELPGKRRAWVRLWHWSRRFDARQRAVFVELCHALAPAALLRRIARGGERGEPFSVAGARLLDAPWKDANLGTVALLGCDLSRGDLSGVHCQRLVAHGIRLTDAKLRDGRFDKLLLVAADVRRSDLSHVTATEAELQKADLRGARLDHATLPGANFTEAQLTDASLRHADLTGACLVGAVLQGADLSDAKLIGAALPRLDLRSCRLDRVHAKRVDLSGARLDDIELVDADLEFAWLIETQLTGAKLVRAKLARATLTRALLADLDAPGADFRDADLSGAVFHMGSTRSGLVFGTPMEGSRTGFYERETLELAYKRPEELRVANLVG